MNESTDNFAWRLWEPPTEGMSMFLWHDGRCAMCGPLKIERPVLDHCHTTGLVRGYLCKSCNIAEGLSGHDMWTLWRNWDNPAHAYGWAEVYEGRGGTPLSPYSDMQFMSGREREAWWAEQITAAAEGREWPALFVLSERAKEREAQLQRDLDLIAWAVTQ